MSIFSYYGASGTAKVDTDHITEERQELGFLAFLGAAQSMNVDFLPLLWHPGLDSLGSGGFATVNEMLVSSEKGLAFKRGKSVAKSQTNLYLSLLSELAISGNPRLRRHPSLLHLMGIGFEPDDPGTLFSPVFVYDRADSDLEHFLDSESGASLDFCQRIQLCAEIGDAIRFLHANGIVHGDIKPQNILVYQENGRCRPKVSDFGCSAAFPSADGESTSTFPQSRPWTAPEYFQGKPFTYNEAVSLDVYAFGLTCLWIIFHDTLRADLQWGPGNGVVSFDPLKEHNCIEDLKLSDQMRLVAADLILKAKKLLGDGAVKLEEVFRSILNMDAATRDLNGALRSMSDCLPLHEPRENQHKNIHVPHGSWELADLEPFLVSESLTQLVHHDYRLRRQIVSSLKEAAETLASSWQGHYQFQLAICNSIGFGVKRNPNEAKERLTRSGHVDSDIERAIQTIKLLDREQFHNDSVKELFSKGLFVETDFATEYRRGHPENLAAAKDEYTRELGDFTHVLGAKHHATLTIHEELMRILSYGEDFEEAEREARRLVSLEQSVYGNEDETTLASQEYYGIILRDLGRYEEAKETLDVVHEQRAEALGDSHPSTLDTRWHISIVLNLLGKFEEAEEMARGVYEKRKAVLGSTHPDTLSSVMPLVDAIINLCERNDTPAGYQDIVDILRENCHDIERVLGDGHEDVLRAKVAFADSLSRTGNDKEAESMLNDAIKRIQQSEGENSPSLYYAYMVLGNFYSDKQRHSEAEDRYREALAGRHRLLGSNHDQTLVAMTALGDALIEQSKFEEAEGYFQQVLEKRLEESDEAEALAIAYTRLGEVYFKQKETAKAKDNYLTALEIQARVLGDDDADTIRTRWYLADVHCAQECFGEAEEYYTRILEDLKEAYPPDHDWIKQCKTGLENVRLRKTNTDASAL